MSTQIQRIKDIFSKGPSLYILSQSQFFIVGIFALKTILFGNICRFTGGYKESTERFHVPVSPVSPLVTSYITTAQYRNQEIDVGIMCAHSSVTFHHHHDQDTEPSVSAKTSLLPPSWSASSLLPAISHPQRPLLSPQTLQWLFRLFKHVIYIESYST